MMIYLDNQSTTRVDPRVVQAMLPTFDVNYANAGSITHEMGITAAQMVEDASDLIAQGLGCVPRELVYTSGATESNNLAILGYCLRRFTSGHIISATTEHKAVLDPLKKLERAGFDITFLPVTQAARLRSGTIPGAIDLEQFEEAIRENTIFVTLMLANNEMGVIHPIHEIAHICRQHEIVLHTDATQAVGHLPVDVNQLDVDLLSFSAHKFYGPKGVGGLYVRQKNRRIRLASQIDGGGQQYGLRSGTLNVSGIVGMARALQLALDELATGEAERLAGLRALLYEKLCKTFGELPINGPDWRVSQQKRFRLPGNLNCQFPGFEGQSLMLAAPQLAVSSGSACTAANPEPSHVLSALGLKVEQSRSSIRFGIGRYNSESEIDAAAEMLAQASQTILQKRR
jgi:cysteine desulfurase